MTASELVIDYDVLNQIAQSVFQTMLEIELFPGDMELADDCLVTMIEIGGAWSGTMSLVFSPDLARNAASQMLKLATNDVTTTDEHEVAAELANMIGGNLKSLLPSPSKLSLPIISPSIGGAAFQHLPPSQVVTLTGLEGSLHLAVNGVTA